MSVSPSLRLDVTEILLALHWALLDVSVRCRLRPDALLVVEAAVHVA